MGKPEGTFAVMRLMSGRHSSRSAIEFPIVKLVSFDKSLPGENSRRSSFGFPSILDLHQIVLILPFRSNRYDSPKISEINSASLALVVGLNSVQCFLNLVRMASTSVIGTQSDGIGYTFSANGDLPSLTISCLTTARFIIPRVNENRLLQMVRLSHLILGAGGEAVHRRGEGED